MGSHDRDGFQGFGAEPGPWNDSRARALAASRAGALTVHASQSRNASVGVWARGGWARSSEDEGRERCSPRLGPAIDGQQAGELGDVPGLRVVVEPPVEPSGCQAAGRLDGKAAPAHLIGLRGRRPASAVQRGLAAAVPAELGQHNRLSRDDRLADHGMQIGQVAPFGLGVLVVVDTPVQGIEVNLEEVEPGRDLAGPKRGVMPRTGQVQRHRPLDQPDRHERLGVRRPDRCGLAARPFAGDRLAKPLVITEPLIGRTGARRGSERRRAGACRSALPRRPPSAFGVLYVVSSHWFHLDAMAWPSQRTSGSLSRSYAQMTPRPRYRAASAAQNASWALKRSSSA